MLNHVSPSRTGDQEQTSVSTAALPCTVEDAWRKVCFYEHITIRPSLLLRLVLPTPQGTSGCHGNVGDTSRCQYSDGGFLTKRITGLEENQRIEFVIVEQSIRFHKRVKLLGGTIRVTPCNDGNCRVEMVTRFRSSLRPKSLARFFINQVIKAMHRIVIQDMRVSLAAQITPPELAHALHRSN